MTTETLERADEVVDRAEIRDGRAVVAYSATERALADLRRRYDGIVFDCATKAGDADARAARQDLVKLRTTLEARRKAFKAPALEFGKLVDAEAQRITGEILKLEQPIDDAIKAEEKRREEERQRRAEAEARRQAAHRQRVAEIRAAATGHGRSTAVTLEQAIVAVAALDIERMAFEEFAPEAEEAQAEALSTLRTLHADAVHREAEQARLQAEAARLAREAEFAQRLNRIAALPGTVAGRSAEAICNAMAAMRALSFDGWAEFAAKADEVRAEALQTLEQLHGQAVERERQQAELQAQREAQAAEQRRIDEERAALERREREAAAALAAVAPPPAPPAPVETAPAPIETPKAESGTTAPESETAAPIPETLASAPGPAIKLTDLCARFGPGFSMTSLFVDAHLGVSFRRERAAVLFTPAEARAACERLAELARRVGGEL